MLSLAINKHNIAVSCELLLLPKSIIWYIRHTKSHVDCSPTFDLSLDCRLITANKTIPCLFAQPWSEGELETGFGNSVNPRERATLTVIKFNKFLADGLTSDYCRGVNQALGTCAPGFCLQPEHCHSLSFWLGPVRTTSLTSLRAFRSFSPRGKLSSPRKSSQLVEALVVSEATWHLRTCLWQHLKRKAL